MRFSLFTDHGALNSKPIFEAFAQGAKKLGHRVVYNSMHADVFVIWSVLWKGRMQQNKVIWDHAIEHNKPIIPLEVGGLYRGTTWKIGIGGIGREAYFGPTRNDAARANHLGLELRLWQPNIEDGDIIICGQNPHSQQWDGMPTLTNWVLNTLGTLRKHTNRRIIVRPHPRASMYGLQHNFDNVLFLDPTYVQGTYDDFDFSVTDKYAIISWSSNPATQAVIAGVPAFVGPGSLAYDVANTDLTAINNPLMPDRTQWLNDIAYTEWTASEIAQGLPLQRLTNRLESVII